ncbi:hypothetical protein PR202_gb02335 [Eleusine coracana subsp. coracana]|uniref:Uncharacterized protein n=1 Tax=Eleusine coracana subsp. coracana TaxID=191504 RepID=A0AAV5DYQ2_ELECO|nr:hypothetical protein PR202_gb02335 [Eleusine coracana subsp. coracana]
MYGIFLLQLFSQESSMVRCNIGQSRSYPGSLSLGFELHQSPAAAAPVHKSSKHEVSLAVPAKPFATVPEPPM